MAGGGGVPWGAGAWILGYICSQSGCLQSLQGLVRFCPKES